jgi:arylsulfatase
MNGYATRMSGKWHLGGPEANSSPTQRGFERYFGTLNGAASYFSPYDLTRGVGGAQAEFEDPNFYLTNAITDNAVRYIEEAPSEKPVFLYVAYTAAHWPLHALPEDIAPYEGKYSMGWDRLRDQRYQRMRELGVIEPETRLSPRHSAVPAWKDEKHKVWQQRRMEVYAAQVTVMDRGVGSILDTLRRKGRYDNTLIIFMIDNGGCHVEYEPDRKGPYLQDKTRKGVPIVPGNVPNIMPGPESTYQSYGYGWANASNTPFRLYKQFDHEGGIHTPMIAHWTNGIKRGGQIEKQVAHLIDITPTLLDISGTELPEEINGRPRLKVDGHSLSPVFKGGQREPHEYLFFQHNHGKAVRSGKWKLVAEGREGRWELYDIEADRNELTDLADKYPEKVRELSQRWQGWIEEQEDRARQGQD